MYILYKATSPSGKHYIGITNNFKRRLKEHGTSVYPFGKALRKYGREAFTYEFEYFDTVEEALARESALVCKESLASNTLYNIALGGSFSNTLNLDNPMHRKDVVANHPSLFSTESNPMNDPALKQKMIDAQASKRVCIEGVEYVSVREAARQYGFSRQRLIHRLKSRNYRDWYYIKD